MPHRAASTTLHLPAATTTTTTATAARPMSAVMAKAGTMDPVDNAPGDDNNRNRHGGK